MYGRWDADIERGTLVGTTPVFSNGDTDVDTASTRIRLDWVDALHVADIRVTPRIALTLRKITVGGYTESGGIFPTRFNTNRDTNKELLYGLDLEKRLNDRAWLRAMIAGSVNGSTVGQDPVVSGGLTLIYEF
jgi:hypothetical protein